MVALTALSLTAPTREVEALNAVQRARFVNGQDVTELQTLASILASLGLEEAAAMVEQPDADLLRAKRARIDRAQTLTQGLDARSVPTFIADTGAKRWMLHANAIYSNRQALISQLQVG